MCIDEAGDDGRSLKIDAACPHAPEASDFLDGAHGANAIPGESDRFSEGLARVCGDDFRADEDDIGLASLTDHDWRRCKKRSNARIRDKSKHRSLRVTPAYFERSVGMAV
jgi:hypothetical protein